jgi:uncharacterized membrane protein
LAILQLITFGFETLGISPEITILILFLMLVGSLVNIPLTKRRLVYSEKSNFFGFFKETKISGEGIFINLGGGVIPFLLSIYFLSKVPLEPVLIAAILMIVVCNFYSRVVPGRGISIPLLIPPVFSVFFALILSPQFVAPTAFISGVFGILIGADILNLRKVQRLSPSFLSIGGAGVFDGIFLVGIVSAILAGIL